MFVSGARVTGPLGPPTTDGSFVRTPEEARAYVRTLKAAGVDHIKVDLTITDDQLRAVIEEANAVGLRVLGHTQNIQKAVEMGFKHMGPRHGVYAAALEMQPLDVEDRVRDLKEKHGLGYCNITKCCTKVCPEGITITDNALIPLKERVVDRLYDPVAKMFRMLRGGRHV